MTPTTLRPARPLRVLGLLALAAAGCGPATGTMSGKVSYKGKPVVFGTVLVVAEDGAARQCVIEPGGTYSVPEVPAGEVRVAVNSPEPKTLDGDLLPREGADPAYRKSFKHVTGWFPVPKKYEDFNTSDLKYVVRGGDNPIDIELK